MVDDDEPFLIAASRSTAYRRTTRPRREEAKLDDAEPTDGLLETGSSLRRRFRRREINSDKAKSGDEEKGNDADANPAAEESKDTSPHAPSLRFQQSTSATQPSSSASVADRHHRSSMPLLNHSSYIRRPPDEKLKEKFKSKLRSVADGIPEVHFIGEVVEGVGFKDTFVSCKWYLEWGKAWSLLEGEDSTNHGC